MSKWGGMDVGRKLHLEKYQELLDMTYLYKHEAGDEPSREVCHYVTRRMFHMVNQSVRRVTERVA